MTTLEKLAGLIAISAARARALPPVSLRALLRLRKACIRAVMAICLVALGGHVYAIPAPGALSSVPGLSLAMIAAAALACAALQAQRPLRGLSRMETTLWALVAGVGLCTPVLQPATAGGGAMGLNTSLSLVSLAVGQLLFARMRLAPFALALLAVIVPFVAMFGHLFGQPWLTGAMTLQAALVLLALGLAGGARYMRRPMLRPLLRRSAIGRAARLSLAGWAAWVVLGAGAMRLVPAVTTDATLFVFAAISALAPPAAVLLLARAGEQRRRLSRRDELALGAGMERDPVTGLHYRGLGELYMRSQTRLRPVGMMMIGVDNWDRIVLEGGRETAELVLRRMSSVISAGAGHRDMVLRYDDRRFLVLSRGKVGAELAQEADHLRVLVNQPGAAGAGIDGHSASIGVAEGRRGQVSLEPTVSAALDAVRSAERTQGGSVVIAASGAPQDPPRLPWKGPRPLARAG